MDACMQPWPPKSSISGCFVSSNPTDSPYERTNVIEGQCSSDVLSQEIRPREECGSADDVG